MHTALRTHPYPTAAPPRGLEPESDESVQRFLQSHRFPSAASGRFLFGLHDEQERYTLVRLRHGLAGHREPPTLAPCSGGVHLIELNAPEVHRVEYRFEVLDEQGIESQVTDPANPARVRDPFGEKSMIATAAYQPPPYIADPPRAARGTLQAMTIDGPLGSPWLTWIWSPPGCSPSTPLPVLVFLDGGDWLQFADARAILENLLDRQRIARCRAVFLKPASRNEEYAANPRTADFLADRLPVALAKHLPWPHEARDRIAVGVSLGGLCLLHAHRQRPKAFGGLILQSGAYFQPHSDPMETGFAYFNRICSFIGPMLRNAGASITRIPIHMTCGAGEENVVNNRIMAEALTRQGFPLSFHLQPDAHNWTCWRDCISGGILRLLSPR